eukprot:13905-Heterococcus_DN1.PRE.3
MQILSCVNKHTSQHLGQYSLTGALFGSSAMPTGTTGCSNSDSIRSSHTIRCSTIRRRYNAVILVSKAARLTEAIVTTATSSIFVLCYVTSTTKPSIFPYMH